MQKVALVNSTTDTFKKVMLRERTDRACFSRVLRHPSTKWSKSILTTPGVKRCDNMYRDDLETLGTSHHAFQGHSRLSQLTY